MDWFNRMCVYGFAENVDFLVFLKNEHDDTAFGGVRKITDHILKLDMAKEISMIQKSDVSNKCGYDKFVSTSYWTHKGVEFLYTTLKNNGILPLGEN